jgi:CheY-like chemotaxis protein
MPPRPSFVLVLAGNRQACRCTANCLETFGYQVLVAHTGADAAILLQQERRISTLVTDADLGGEVDGLAVAMTARRLNPAVRVIYTSARPHAIPAGRKVTGAPSLRAPYQPNQIIGIISELRGQAIDEQREPRAA